MRNLLRRIVPSMFRRRLLLVGMLGACASTALVGQMIRLTVVDGDMWQQRAEAVLASRRVIPTARGSISDRFGRVLAEDRPTYNLTVWYPVITGRWVHDRAEEAARRANRHVWPELDYSARERLVGQHQPVFEAQLDQLWRVVCDLGGIGTEELDARKATVIERVRVMSSVVWVGRMRRRQSSRTEATVRLADVAQPLSEQLARYAILDALDSKVIIEIRRLIANAEGDPNSVWRHVAVEPSKQRVYPYETISVSLDESELPAGLARNGTRELTVEDVGRHFLGAMRVWNDNVAWPRTRPFSSDDLGGYLPGDRIGYWGIERSLETHLRGSRGQAIKMLDHGTEQRIEPRRGADVILAIDIHLQARIQALMDPAVGLTRGQTWHSRLPSELLGQPLNGTAVVLEVNSGEVLAAVSMPPISVRQLQDQPQAIWNDAIHQPFLNRPVARPYQPGSILKPLVLAAAFTDGKLGLSETIECTGALDPQTPEKLRCWLYKLYYPSVHDHLDGPEAIARSCNIFFYTLGRRLGPQRLTQWYRAFGFGQRSGCGLVEEVGGDLPTLRSEADRNRPVKQFEAILMAVGQGPVRTTALQIASAYAALARGGYVLPPTFVKEPTEPERSHGYKDLNLDPRGLALVMDGLEQAVNSPHGTANHLGDSDEPIFTIEGVHIFGKTGTAESVPLRIDSNGDGRITSIDHRVRSADHAWFVGLVQRPDSPRPDFAIAVVMEYTGSGGAIAGPVSNHVLYALRAEGYL